MANYKGPIANSGSNEGPEDETPNSQESKREADLEVKKPVRKAKKIAKMADKAPQINIRKAYKD
jgi:hypothetical protein